MTEKTEIIAIDGPSGSGKSTTARAVAKKLGFVFLDTGAMYRALTLLALENDIEPADEAKLSALAEKIDIKFADADDCQKVYVDDRDITDDIRTPVVTRAVSEVSAHPKVREHLVAMQKEIGRKQNIVAEGRDTTSVVFPDAGLKVYLSASIEERARRRLKDFERMGKSTTLADQIRDIKRRDDYDSGRRTSPLTKTSDSIEVDTTNMTIDQQVDKIIELFRARNSA